MNSKADNDITQSKDSIDNTADIKPDIVDKAKVCPTCNYTTEGSEFQTCPKCGLIISKHHKRKRHNITDNLSGSAACKACGCDISTPASFCTNCGETLAGKDSRSLLRKNGVLIVCFAAVVLLVLIFSQLKFRSESSSPPTSETSQKSEPSNPTVPAISPTQGTIAYATNSPKETQPANSSASPAGIPNAMANTLGITKAKIVFASAVDNSHMPLNDLSRISINEKRIFSHLKMVISPEKSYQFTGRLYDGEGKLVMNITSPSTPKVAVWYAWYYHDFDRTVDKPGAWKFAFLVNGEPIAEQLIEVTEP